MITSSKPRKQRKWLFNAPLHKRQKLVAATLSKELRKDFDKKSLTLREGDKVQIMRGDFAGTKGKVVNVDLKSYRVEIDEAKRRKSNGTEVKVPIHPSNIMITEPSMTDKMRARIVERAGGKVTLTKPEKEAKKEDKKEKGSAQKCQICGKEVASQKEMSDHMGKEHKAYTQ